MEKNSKYFFKELAALLEKYDARVSADNCGDYLLIYVGEKLIDFPCYADAESVRDFLSEAE